MVVEGVELPYIYTQLFNYKILHDLIETVFVEINVPNKKNIIVGTIYRPPASDGRGFLEELLNLP